MEPRNRSPKESHAGINRSSEAHNLVPLDKREGAVCLMPRKRDHARWLLKNPLTAGPGVEAGKSQTKLGE